MLCKNRKGLIKQHFDYQYRLKTEFVKSELIQSELLTSFIQAIDFFARA